MTLGVWHQVVATCDGNSARLYIDGVLKLATTPGPYTIAYDDNTPLMLNKEYYFIGCYFNGLIDDVMVYNRALSVEEVMAHYLLPPP